MAALTAAVLALAAASTYSAVKSARAKPPEAPVLPPTPNAADDAVVAEAHRADAVTTQRKRAAGAYSRSDTLLTGPAGVTTPAPVVRKTLLGQ